MELLIRKRDGRIFCVVYDEIDQEAIRSMRWYIHPRLYVFSVVYNGKSKKTIRLHRFLLGLENNKFLVDHKNRNPLDNRRCNLRICSYSENNRNVSAWGKSKYLGVSIADGKFVVGIKHNGKRQHIGTFANEMEAAMAYDKMAIVLHGEFANLNFK